MRQFQIVKVDLDGNEGSHFALPDDTLEKMPELLKRFIKSLPNGRYRIYLTEGVEGGEKISRVIREFYKSGKSLGDPVHEVGPGSVEGEQPVVPAKPSQPSAGGSGHTTVKKPDGATAIRRHLAPVSISRSPAACVVRLRPS